MACNTSYVGSSTLKIGRGEHQLTIKTQKKLIWAKNWLFCHFTAKNVVSWVVAALKHLLNQYIGMHYIFFVVQHPENRVGGAQTDPPDPENTDLG